MTPSKSKHLLTQYIDKDITKNHKKTVNGNETNCSKQTKKNKQKNTLF